jgi:hypothetical protein
LIKVPRTDPNTKTSADKTTPTGMNATSDPKTFAAAVLGMVDGPSAIAIRLTIE